jgi:HlyD family secretion protein
MQLVQLKADTRGRVREVMVQPGDTVKAGQVLALLDMEEQEVEQRRLRNSLQALQERMHLAQHQLDSASSDWQAVRPLYKQDEATPIKPKEWVRVEERRSEVKQLSLQEEDLRLQLLKLDKALAKAVLRSPIDGQVLTRQVEVGNVVGSALDSGNGRDSLFEIADTGALRAECAVREADAFELRQGQAVQLVAGQKAPPIALTLTQLSPVISQDQGSVRKLWLDIPRAQAAQLTVGMSATAYFTQTAKELE